MARTDLTDEYDDAIAHTEWRIEQAFARLDSIRCWGSNPDMYEKLESHIAYLQDHLNNLEIERDNAR